jgi:deazaflavin-dependent oxidoreductase (nitroreductase family)
LSSLASTPPDLGRLASIRTIDITTYGRKSGKPRRIEIWWFHVNGRFIITGTPGRRDWLANVRANPSVIVHVDGRDIEATANLIEERESRLEVFSQPDTSWYSTQAQLDHLVAEAPMIEIDLSADTQQS